MNTVGVNSGEARHAIERSRADEPNRFDAVNAADAAYNAFLRELRAITVSASVLGYHSAKPEHRVHYKGIAVSRGAWDARGKTVFTDMSCGTTLYELAGVQS